MRKNDEHILVRGVACACRADLDIKTRKVKLLHACRLHAAALLPEHPNCEQCGAMLSGAGVCAVCAVEAHMDGCGRTTYNLAKSAERAEAEVERLRALISAIREAALAVGVGIVYMGGVPIVSVNHEEMDTRRWMTSSKHF